MLLVLAINWIVRILTWIIFIDVILTFIPTIDRRSPFVKFIRSIAEPMYRPIKKVVPVVRVGDAGLDLSPVIAMLGIQFIGYLLINMLVRA